MSKTRRAAVVLAVAAIALLGSACDDDPPSAPADGSSSAADPSQTAAGLPSAPDAASFCSANAGINQAIAGEHSVDEFLALLKPYESKLDAYVVVAPDVVRTDAVTLVDAAHRALATNDGNVFLEPALGPAGQHIADFCAAPPAAP